MRKEEHRRLLGVERPSDFGLWCLNQAIIFKNKTAIEWFLGNVVDCLHFDFCSEGLSREVISSRLVGHVGLQHKFNNRLSELEASDSDVSDSDHQGHTQLRSERPNWHEHLKPYEKILRENRAEPVLLNQLAEVYFGAYINVRGSSPRERLSALLAGDEHLVEAVLFGFCKTKERDDLPSDRKIIRLGTSNRTHLLALPFVAGLEEIATNAAPTGDLGIDEKHLRLALAVYFTVPMWSSRWQSASNPPNWVVWTLSQCPELFADVLVQSVLSQLRKGKTSPEGLHDLVHSPAHESVARVAAIPLLKRFPTRCKFDQLSSLNHLLRAAIRHCDVESLLELVEKKLTHRSMNVAQRVYWLVAGLSLAPETYVDALDLFASTTERRIRFLADAVTNQFDHFSDLQYQQNVPALRLLIGLIGSSYRPISLFANSNNDVTSTEMNTADLVRRLIEKLAAISTEDASHALESLSCNNDLHPWHSLLVNANYRQKALRREAEFTYGDVAQVLATLDNVVPANVADLAALTLEHLRQIAREIRHGNTSDWRQYWNVDQYNRPQVPRPEPACRDLLVSNLRSKLLHLGIDVQPEARYTDDKRADIGVSFGLDNVPVEVKRSCHRDLWSAIQSQLKTRYIRDPRTGGYGIYIVFWFGNTEVCRPTPPMKGLAPADSQELESQLKCTLSAQEQRKILICVIDVAVPSSSVTA